MEDNLVQKFQIIYNNINSERSDIYLFAILKMDEYVDKWSVIVSASWIRRENQRDGFNYIARKMQEVLSEKDVSTIARIGTFQPDEHIVRLFNNSVSVQGGSSVKLEDTKINGFQIHEAYIYQSKFPELQSQ